MDIKARTGVGVGFFESEIALKEQPATSPLFRKNEAIFGAAVFRSGGRDDRFKIMVPLYLCNCEIL